MLLLNKNLLRMAKGLWGWMILICVLKIIVLVGGTEFASVIASFLGTLTDLDMNFFTAKEAVVWALLYALMMFGGELLIGEAEYRCTAKAREKLRTSIFSKVLELDVGHIEKIGPTSAITSCVDGVESMQMYFSKYLPSLFYCLFAPFYLFFRLRSVSISIAGFLLAASVIILPLNNIFRQYTERLKKRYWSDMEDLTGYYLESVRGLVTLKLFNQDDKRADTLSKKAYRFCQSIMAMMKVNFLSFLMSDGIIYLSIFISTWMAVSQYHQGILSLSDTLMILMMSFTFFGSVRSLMSATHSALAGVAASARVEEIMMIDASKKEADMQTMVQPYQGFEVKDAVFSYGSDKTILDHVSLKIPQGKTIALVGRSGSGKSTIAHLLMHFDDLEEGKILLNGQDICAYSTEKLRQEIIMVPQNVGLFSGTIASNLRIADENCSDERLWEALEEVRLKEKVESFENGLYSTVGDAGARLSGGERQKIGIARALLSGAPYIIFDEATSSVDIESENEIWDCLHQLSKTKTLIIISHRLSTIKNADCIYVLEHGRVIESGRHEELMKEQKLYHALVLEQQILENQIEEGTDYERN